MAYRARWDPQLFKELFKQFFKGFRLHSQTKKALKGPKRP